MKITFYGHASLGIQVNDVNILVDPFISANPKASNIDINSLEADYILITHAHQDHIVDVETIAKRTGAILISNFEIISYYEKLVEAINMPLLIYNIPATTHHSIPLKIVEELSHHPNIVGIKDSERNLERMENSIKMWSSSDDFVHLLGCGAELSNALMMGFLQ